MRNQKFELLVDLDLDITLLSLFSISMFSFLFLHCLLVWQLLLFTCTFFVHRTCMKKHGTGVF